MIVLLIAVRQFWRINLAQDLRQVGPSISEHLACPHLSEAVEQEANLIDYRVSGIDRSEALCFDPIEVVDMLESQ
jgi:hypothetical protein